MASTLNSRLLQPRSFLTRLLQTIGLALALITASAAGIHAEDVTVVGAAGENGAVGVNPGDVASWAATRRVRNRQCRERRPVQ